MTKKAKMDWAAFERCRAELPTRETLTVAHAVRIGALYVHVLLAAQQQAKRHRLEPGELLHLGALHHGKIPGMIEKRRGRKAAAAAAAAGAKQDGETGGPKTGGDGEIGDLNDDGDEGGAAYMTKEELQDLMEWKMARGTFRPTLRSLVAQNEARTVEATTREAFAAFEEELERARRKDTDKAKEEGRARKKDSGKAKEEETDPPSTRRALDILCRLRGVGPATASLLLSAAFPATVPFFSDEAYHFYSAKAGASDHDDNGENGINGKKKSKGVEQQPGKLRYTLAEYAVVEQGVRRTLRKVPPRWRRPAAERHTGALEIEQVAYVVRQLHDPAVWQAVIGGKEDPKGREEWRGAMLEDIAEEIGVELGKRVPREMLGWVRKEEREEEKKNKKKKKKKKKEEEEEEEEREEQSKAKSKHGKHQIAAEEAAAMPVRQAESAAKKENGRKSGGGGGAAASKQGGKRKAEDDRGTGPKRSLRSAGRVGR